MNDASLTIVVPLPPAVLKPNRRTHWAVRARATETARSDARYASMTARRRQKWTLGGRHINVIQLIYYFKARRTRDEDNLLAWAKATIDGVADGLELDDGSFTYMPTKSEIDKKDPRLEIVIT